MTRSWFARHQAELLLSLRMMIAAVLTFAISNAIGLEQGYWAVLTVIVVTQSSVGGSIKLTLERVVGTIAGAVWAILVSWLLQSQPEIVILTVALAPLTLVAALQPAYRIAPITAIIILLGSVGHSSGALLTAFHRMLDIVLGCVVAFAVSLFVLPARAHDLLGKSVAHALDYMADAATSLGSENSAALEQVRRSVLRVAAVADEAKRERLHRLTSAPDPDPMLRALRRVRHDLETIGRLTDHQLPEPVEKILAAPRDRATRAVRDFLRAMAGAIANDKETPSLDGVVTAVESLHEQIDDIRHGGQSQNLSVEDSGRMFGAAFAFEQLQTDLGDLANRAKELTL